MSGALPLPSRPDFGRNGQTTMVKANYFEITTFPSGLIWQYDVKIIPEKLPPAKNRLIFQQYAMLTNNDSIVYDGRAIAFSIQQVLDDKLSIQDMQLTASSRGHQSKKARTTAPLGYTVKLRLTDTIDTDHLRKFLKLRAEYSTDAERAISAMDILIRHEPSMMYSTVGRSFYLPKNAWKLSGGLEAWPGVFQSVKSGGGADKNGQPTGRLFVNIDTTSTVYFKGDNLIELTCDILGKRRDDLRYGLKDHEIRIVEKTIKDLKIEVTHRGSNNAHPKFKIHYLDPESAERKRFFNEETQAETTIADYFRRTYNMRLEFGQTLPLVCVRKDTFLPMEVCRVMDGQRYKKKLNPQQTSEMIKRACAKPRERIEKIMNSVRDLEYHKNRYLNSWKVNVDTHMLDIEARILDQPKLQYFNRTHVSQAGVWNLQNQELFRGAIFEHWSIVAFGSRREIDEQMVQGFVRSFCQACHTLGINIKRTAYSPNTEWCNPQSNILQSLQAVKHKTNPQIIVCILLSNSKNLYGEIKKVSDCHLGLPTQCLLAEKLRGRPNIQYLANVCLKVNSKLNGINVTMDKEMLPYVHEVPTMLVGADVTHPPQNSNNPSIACVVASYDRHCARYATELCYQTSRMEYISQFERMMLSLLNFFRAKNGLLPKRILIYRDGVSQGQFGPVKAQELAAVKQACAQVYGEKEKMPFITLVIVQKRHHTRFFPTRSGQTDRSGNCIAGTVIDTIITHPTEFDFYLQSQAGLQGTSRPTHYYVIHDEYGFRSDELQELTFRLCFLYARCTRSVSIVSPVYYAHLGCFRARFYLKEGDWSEENSSDAQFVTGSQQGQSLATGANNTAVAGTSTVDSSGPPTSSTSHQSSDLSMCFEKLSEDLKGRMFFM